MKGKAQQQQHQPDWYCIEKEAVKTKSSLRNLLLAHHSLEKYNFLKNSKRESKEALVLKQIELFAS